MRTSDPGYRFYTDVRESIPFCQRALEALYALATSNRSIPSSLSKARNPNPGVLSTSGIRNHDAVDGVDAPAAQEIHDVRPLLRSSRIDEITLATGLHEHAIPLADVDKAYG